MSRIHYLNYHFGHLTFPLSTTNMEPGDCLFWPDRSGIEMKKFKLDRIISIATLLASLVAIVLVLRKPTPVAHPQAPAAVAQHAQSFDQKMAEFEQASQQTVSDTAVTPHLTLGRLKRRARRRRYASTLTRSVPYWLSR